MAAETDTAVLLHQEALHQEALHQVVPPPVVPPPVAHLQAAALLHLEAALHLADMATAQAHTPWTERVSAVCTTMT